ncbi:hypothetical protein OPV22_022645 [Ensete ventricosum]|uniref:Uncharacterized protein n=1 Tax=Ensete ventricosum TaxID=4639 RepID=A0AAV8QUY9_ENSVE|nr:hypothetical protein OPV22_022645 [Ensete ventricosum]
MEAVFSLRAALITPFKRPGCLPFHPTSNLAPLGHLSFPRHYRVSCSHAQPPRPPTPEKDKGRKGRAGGRKWPRAAAVVAAFVVACALGSVCLTRPAPDAAVEWCTSWTAHNEGPSRGGGKGTMNTEGNKLGNQAQSEKTNSQNSRDAVQQILFGKKVESLPSRGRISLPWRKDKENLVCSPKIGSKNWKKYEAGILSAEMLMDMAIIYFTLTVEKMTSTAGHAAHPPVLHERRHLRRIGHRLFDRLEHVVGRLPLLKPHETRRPVVPDLLHPLERKQAFGQVAPRTSSCRALLRGYTSAPSRWLSMATRVDMFVEMPL